jgi:tRNA pseudouridine55 synthase
MGMTSHDVVGLVRKLYGTKRVGHTGTLDPMASGVLVVLVGRAAKATEYISSASKRYRAVMRLGITTDTEDTTGEILTACKDIPKGDAVRTAAAEFVGEIMQIPPMYSALKVGGRKLCDLARQGISVERQPRPITVHSLTVRETDSKSDYVLDVHCSGGTYIRTLCADIGASLGCGGVMAALERTAACGFDISESYDLDALKEKSYDELVKILLPVETLFEDLSEVKLPEFYEKLFRSGCEIYQKKIFTSHEVGTRLRVVGKRGFFALGEVVPPEKCGNPELGSAVKSIKMFDIES